MMLRLALLALLSAVAIAASPLGAQAETRLGLIIGNAKYPDSEKPLKEPINDARALADEFKRDGFEVEVGENLTGDGMRKAFDRLYAKIKPGSAVLLFFGGYGIQSARQSYLVPVDAQIWTESDVRRDGFSLETILNEMNGRGAAVKIALLDASRRNPFERRFRSFSAGLAPVIAPSGTLVMYSAALSSVVSDNGGDRSLFVGELLKEIRVPGLTAEETLNRTRVGVTRASRSEQVPWISSSLADEFSFVPGPRPVIAAAKPAGNEPPPLPPRKEEPAPAASAPASAATAPPAKQPSIAEKLAATAPDPAPVTLPPRKETPPPPLVIEPPPKEQKQLELALADDPTIKQLNAKLTENPGDPNALYRRGQVYASKGAYALAVRDFDETIRINPRDVEALNNRCFVRAVIGDLQPALKDCNEALRLRPNFVDALDSRGLLNLKAGQFKNAIADFDAALKINPRLTSSLYGRGLARQRSGAGADGDIDMTTAKGLDPNIAQEFASYGVR